MDRTTPDDEMEQARFAHLQAETTRVGMERLGEWKGFLATYWFRCSKEHQVVRYLRSFSLHSTLAPCQPCKENQRTQQLRTLARRAGVTVLSHQWLGEKANHNFCCSAGHTWTRTGRTALNNMTCPQCSGGRAIQADKLLLPDGLKRLHAAAQRHDGECLSQQYLGLMRKYEFRCAKGHVWQARGASIMKNNTWCPRCQHWPIDRDVWQVEELERLRAAATARGGECLAERYAGANVRHHFRCAKGHEWEAKASHVLSGTWCRACYAQSQRLSIEDAQRIARERGGQCLSTEYVRCQEKLHWICHRGHSWHSAFSNIRSGRWCPTCKHMARLSSATSKVRQRYESHER